MLTSEPIPDEDENEDNAAILADPKGPKTPKGKGKGRKREHSLSDIEQLIPSPPPPPPLSGRALAGGLAGGLEGMAGMAPSGSARKLMESAAAKLRRRQKTAMTLRVVRKWLMKIIYAQAIGNMLRALPIFILEKYMVMLLIFFQLIFLACGYFGTKLMRPYLLLLYSIGILATTFPDVTVAITYVRHSLNLPAAEAGTAFAVYVVLVSALAVLNVVGGLLLGIRMCVSVMILKNPQEYALVLQAASWIGSFEGRDDTEEEAARSKKIQRRSIVWGAPSSQEEIPITPPPKFASNEVITSKYNAVTFFPRLVYLQFSRLANLYTLCIVVLCMFSFSPVGPLSSLTPLLVVFGVAGIKELVEDIKRHKQDKLINTRGTLVFKHEHGDFVPATWAEVQVGDVLMINNGEMIPCDLILLSTSRQDGRCYLETANLDGETNLKHRAQLPQLGILRSPKDLVPMKLSLECEGPNSSIYTFEGALTARFPEEGQQNTNVQSGSHVFSVGGDMLLQRGTLLRNTQWIYGLSVYTGKETKVEQNGVPAPLKRSYLEKSVNLKLIVLLLLQTIVCIICAIGHNKWKLNMPRPEETYPWYVFAGPDEHDYIYVSYLILYNTMIPLSMYVSMEMVRVTNSTQITGAEGISGAAVRSTSIMEELGQVQYLFADKTGTLTCNEMVVRRLSVVGMGVERFQSNEDSTIPEHSQPSHALLSCHRNTSMSARDECLLLMVLCNTVQVETAADGSIKYSTGSPDEEALVRSAASSGVELIARENNTLTINWHGTHQVFTVLQILEFNSYRRRMSVIVRREEDGAILLLCKGADSVIFARLRPAALGTAETTQHINEFAAVGLRTLCFAATTLDPEVYSKWSAIYHEATLSVEHRSQRVDEAAEQIETHLTLLGAVGIEDRLQPGVPDCVSSLQEAGIHVWVLTGDKTETAIAVATQASVLTADMQIEILEEANEKALIRRLATITEQLSLIPPLPPLLGVVVGFLGLDPLSLPPLLRPPPPPMSLALVLTDVSLPIALSREVRYHFLSIAKAATAVVCTRCSPIHKAKVVKLVSERSFLFGDGAITLAIGDGANDVPMIRYAHIGVGISGREGMQAVLASDFSITQFSDLKKLLLVHGARCHKRIAKLVLYSFCKNVALSLSQFWFGFYNGFSGQMMFFDFLFTLFNSLFTAIPILMLSTIDREHSDATLLSKPALYKTTSSNSNFSTPKFLGWLILGIWQSLMVFYFPFLVMRSSSSKSGDLWVLGTSAYSILVFSLSIQVCLITSYWTPVNIGGVVGSVLFYFVFICVYCQVFTNGIGVLGGMFGSIDFWLMLLVVPLLSVCPYVIYRLLVHFFSDRHQEDENKEQEDDTLELEPYAL